MAHVNNVSPGKEGSKILLTTRSKKVAKTVESTTLIDLPSLSEDCSWQIFQQSFGNAVNDLDHEFQEVGKEIVNKCGGVPLAIEVLAGILCVKERVEQWQAIKESNLLNVEGEERQVSACLRLSYFNMPSHLKKCFTICSIFPKGHLIDKDQLIDQWIALDMIPGDRVNYLEYITGNDYFNHLVQMCFIQDVKEAENGRVKCKLHDLVHDLARSIVDDEISLVVPKKEANFTKTCRYFSLMENTRHFPPKNTFKKARAMYICEDDDFIFGKASKNAKHLRSITVKDVHASALKAILQTKTLRHLNISGLKCGTLPEDISEIWSLQALHVTSSHLVKLPESIGKLQKLRVVNLSNCWSLTGLPKSIGKCLMISSIDLSRCYTVATLPSSIDKNKRLRVLRLGYTKLERLPSSVTTLENLELLHLECCSKLVELPEGIGNLKKLVVLNLKGCNMLRAILKGIAQLTRLETLGLFVMGEGKAYAQFSELENINRISGKLTISGIGNSMDPDVAHKECLNKKANLHRLTLIFGRDVCVNSENLLEGLEPPCKIKSLKIVGYPGQESTQWMLKHRGAEVSVLSRFQSLSKLELSDFPKLQRLEGLTELPCLEKLVLKNMTALKCISGGPFPSLLELSLEGMYNLGLVWMATEGSLAPDVEGGQLQIGNRLSVLNIGWCPNLVVMPYFPSSLTTLCLHQSNVELLEQPGLGQGSSLPSFSFSCLKELVLGDMAPPAGAASYGSRYRWAKLRESMQSLSFPLSPADDMAPGCRWELLQHLTALESLKIKYCKDLTELPESIRSLTFLRTLEIFDCRHLRLPEWLGELCYLEKMNICDLWLGSSSFAPSMQPLRALKALSIRGCTAPQSLRQFTSLTNLEIYNSGDIRQLPSSLQMLHIGRLSSLSSLPQSLGHLTSLQHLRIENFCELEQLPDCLGELHCLRVFEIWDLLSLTSLPRSWGGLTSLQELEIGRCKALGQLPESLGELCSLRKFGILVLWGLTSFPKSMCFPTSLEQLVIVGCPGIRSLPKWIKDLTSLQTLEIGNCPDLERRCRRGKGKDWHLISHIPHVRIERD